MHLEAILDDQCINTFLQSIAGFRDDFGFLIP